MQVNSNLSCPFFSHGSKSSVMNRLRTNSPCALNSSRVGLPSRSVASAYGRANPRTARLRLSGFDVAVFAPVHCRYEPQRRLEDGEGFEPPDTLAGLPVFETKTRPLKTFEIFVFYCNTNCLELHSGSLIFADFPTQCAKLCQDFRWHSKPSARR